MNQRFKLRWFFVALLIGVAVMLPCFSVQASEKPSMTIDSTRGVSSLISSVNKESKKVGSFKLLSIGEDKEDGGHPVYINKEEYNKLTSLEKRELMEYTLDEVSNCDLPAKERTRLYNFIAEQDSVTSSVVRQLSQNVNADYGKAWLLFKPFSGGLGTALGVLALLIVAFIAISTVVDIAILVIPFFQTFAIKGDKRPKYMSLEAYRSYLDAESSKKYRSSIWIYLGRRSKMLLVVGVCLGYLVAGKIFMLVGYIIDTISTMFGI